MYSRARLAMARHAPLLIEAICLNVTNPLFHLSKWAFNAWSHESRSLQAKEGTMLLYDGPALKTLDLIVAIHQYQHSSALQPTFFSQHRWGRFEGRQEAKQLPLETPIFQWEPKFVKMGTKWDPHSEWKEDLMRIFTSKHGDPKRSFDKLSETSQF